MITRRIACIAAFAFSAFLTSTSLHVFAETPEIFARDGIAINGADPVAYFTEGEPVIGSSEYSLNWREAEWWFSSAENRALFEEDPEAYAPQYGGYCAYAVALNATATTEPEFWNIHEGKLYLNFNRPTNRRWDRNKEDYIAQADENWPAVLE